MGSWAPDISLCSVGKQAHAWQRQPCKEPDIIVFERPLSDAEIAMVRQFLERTTHEDLRLRFGCKHDFREDANLRHFFDIAKGDIAWILDKSCAIAAILHRFPISSVEAEIAILVRSDLKRTGIGEAILRDAVERSRRSPLKTLSSMIAWENKAAFRLARKLGFVARTQPGLSIEMELKLEGTDDNTLVH